MNDDNKSTIKNNKDKFFIAFVLAYFVIQAINLYIKTLEIDIRNWEFISKGMLAGFLFLVIIKSFKINKLFLFLTIEAACSFLFLISICLSPNSLAEGFNSIAFNAIFAYLPLGFCIYIINDYELFLKKLYTASWIIGFILITLAFNIKIDVNEYYMTFGYSLLFPLLVVMDHYKHSKKKADLVYILTCSIAILVAGSRGPLICIAVYVMISYELYKKIGSVILFVILYVVAFYSTDLFHYISNILLKYDIRSRSIELFLDENYSDSGRSGLLEYFYNQMHIKPFLGWGVASGWYLNLFYPHNIFMDLIVSFGIPIGCILSIILIVLILSGLKSKDKDQARLFTILFSLSISLLYTGTFIKNQTFFMFLAISLKIFFGLTNKQTNKGWRV